MEFPSVAMNPVPVEAERNIKRVVVDKISEDKYVMDDFVVRVMFRIGSPSED